MQSKMLIRIEIHETSLVQTCLQSQSFILLLFVAICCCFIFGKFDSCDKIHQQEWEVRFIKSVWVFFSSGFSIATKFIEYAILLTKCCVTHQHFIELVYAKTKCVKLHKHVSTNWLMSLFSSALIWFWVLGIFR